jgi:steroid delta-isomerase-like uncharacterized protein
MHEQDNVKDILHQAFQALNTKAHRSHYFDLHDDSLVTHGLPENFSSDKEGMKKFYSEVWHAFPDANFKLDRVVAEGSEAACMFSLVGTQKNEFMGVPPSDKQIKIDGMIFFHFRASKIVERWEIIDMVSAMKQLGARQQLSAVKNAILEYAETRADTDLKKKITGLFNRHQISE